MNIYLQNTNKVTPIYNAYDVNILNQIWDYVNFHTINDLDDISKDGIIESCLIVIERTDIFRLLHEHILSAVKNCKNKKIIILYHGKSISAPKATAGLNYDHHLLVDTLGFDSANIMYIVQLKADIKHVYDIFGPSVKVTDYDRWLEELNRYQIKHSYKSPKNHLYKDPDRPDKKFSVCIRRYEDIRLEAMCELISKDLLKDFYYTFAARGGHMPEDIGVKLASFLNNLPQRYIPYRDKIQEWAKGIPYEAEKIEPGNCEVYDSYYSMKLGNYYNHCKVVFVVETHCEHTDNLRADFSIVTEKIYKAMLYKKPFILLSQPRTLQVLRECGYKTFDHVINESYDKLETFPERLNAISEELNRIRNLDDISLQNLLDSCQENVEHNYNLMLKESFKSIPQEFTIRNFIKYD